MHILSDIKLTGPDAFQFLQGQVSNDLRRLENEAEIIAVWCNPKGRVIWFGTIRQVDGGYSLSAPAEIAEDIVKRLTMFRFRSK
ncbi:MAG: folate-binding protein, partial [Gammaproteobacteria bacterium]|nr:folate-binding protein [Gammaproteobacteria bacterium]